jgi:hypothetical protein
MRIRRMSRDRGDHMAGAALVGAGIRARPDSGGGRRQCTDIHGYLDDPAPAGRAVHAAPSAASPVVGRIAPPWTDGGGGSWPVSFRIKATQAGWLQVEGAGDDPELIEARRVACIRASAGSAARAFRWRAGVAGLRRAAPQQRNNRPNQP